MSLQALPQLLVVCLCAEWCGTCREYRPGFEALAGKWPEAAFFWIDVEDEAQWVADLEVENFPTLLIQRGETVLFYGTMLPQHGILQRTLETLSAFSDDEAQRYANANAERRHWQAHCNQRSNLAAHLTRDRV